jgi:hypothetical protein
VVPLALAAAVQRVLATVVPLALAAAVLMGREQAGLPALAQVDWSVPERVADPAAGRLVLERAD